MDFKANYLTWLKENMFSKKIDESTVELTMPFLDRHNDYTQIYIIQEGEERYSITDFGHTINDLEISGIDILSSQKRKKIFEMVLNRLGLRLDLGDRSLFISCSYNNLANAQHRLVQGMLDINNMFMLSSPTVENLFVEDVASFFDEHNLYYSKDIHVVGKSNFEHRYDFLMTPSKNKPERFIKVMNIQGKGEVERAIFSWEDTLKARYSGKDQSPELIIVVNDNNRKFINPEWTGAFEEYGIKDVPWSKRNENIDLFAS